MRELKFRVWQPKIKSMAKIESFDCARQSAYWFKILMDIQKIEDNDYVPVTTNSINRKDEPDFVLMEFTGLRDKNGIEIYEGDIVYSKNWEGSPKKVRFYNGSFIASKGNRSKKHILHPTMIYKRQLEIIGNIYENPELLLENKPKVTKKDVFDFHDNLVTIVEELAEDKVDHEECAERERRYIES